MNAAYVHYGASTSAVESWLNFDASPTVRVQNLPVVGPSLAKLSGNGFSFPTFLKYGDIVKGLPVAENSAAAVFSSHVLEHLSLEDANTALRNTLRILRPGGVFRVIVPDLRERARRYVERTTLNPEDPEAAHEFMRVTDLGEAKAMAGIRRRLRLALGHSRHHWMWDFPAMRQAMEQAGFVDVRRCSLGDAEDPMFAKVEQADRYNTGDIQEVAVEGRKPG